MRSGSRNEATVVHQYAVVCAVEDAFLKQQDRIVEIVDFPLLNPQQLVTLGDRVHQHLLGLHEMLEHQWIRRMWG